MLTDEDVTDALSFTPEDAAEKGQANGYASLDGDGKVPSAQLPAGAGVTSFNTRSGAVTLEAADVTAALGFTPENAAAKNQANGYAGLSAASKLALAQIPTGVELTANKGQANGYASLDGGTKIPIAQIPTAAIPGWTTITKTADESRTNTTTFADDSTLLFNVAANTKYRIRIFVYYSIATATPDIKSQVTGPAAPTLVVVRKGGSPALGAFTFPYRVALDNTGRA